MAGILKFALGLDLAQFGPNAKKVEEWLEHVTKTGVGGVFGEIAENLHKAMEGIRTSVSAVAGGGGGFTAMATAVGTAMVAVQALEGVLHTIEEMIERVVEKFVEAAREGATLYYLSQRTQTSIPALYGLREGAKGIGLAESAPTDMILKLQRALSGVSETGERTENTFAALRLNMRELRALAPEKQFIEVAEALSRVNAAARPGLASNIFGRSSYGDILQLTAQLDSFKEAMVNSASGGALFKDVGQAFADAGTKWDELKSNITLFFAGFGKYLVEALKDLLDLLNAFPWQAAGEAIGIALLPLTRLLSLQANLLQFELHPIDFTKRKVGELHKEIYDNDDQDASFMAHLKRFGNFFAGIPNPGPDPKGANGENQIGMPYSPSHQSAFEKMGFVFGSGADSSVDYQRRTAIATEKAAEHLEGIRRDRISQPSAHELRNAA